jgi:predicted acyl esterase
MRSSVKWTALPALIATAMMLTFAPAASAEIPNVFGGDVTCEVQGDGVRFCGSTSPRSTTPAWDGVPIDVNVAFPPAPASGPDGSYPLVMIFHGYGGSKIGLSGMRTWLDQGYATFSMTDRGFHESCGSEESRAANPDGCANGFVRLMDTRYEVRDAQEFAGELADAGLVDPQRIGAVGGSYGGGMSMALAALRDRKMLPDGSLVPWQSPAGTPMRIAAAAPNIPWTDLAYALSPNGSTLDYVARAPYQGRYGVMKQSFTNGLYFSGLIAPGFYAPVGTPGADLTGWRERLEAGEPYFDAEAQAILAEVTSHHSSYYIDPSVPPAPLLISNGFTDDLFPADEALRFYNRTRTKYPKADISLFFGDFGHMRAQNKEDATQRLRDRVNEWFAYYLTGPGAQRGKGSAEPFQGVEVLTQTCPDEAPSGGPFFARNWARIARGEVRLRSPGDVTIAPDSGDPAIAAAFDPVSGGGACAQTSGADEPGTATYRLDPAPSGGYTLVGAPTVIADFTLPGDTSQVAARLLDVAPDGQQTLVARGLWRPATGESIKQVFQLHPNGWEFAEGHVPKLELLAKDAAGGVLDSYGRPSNDQQPVTVSNLELRLPVREKPGTHDGLVKQPASKVLPRGYKLARDFKQLPRPRPKVAGGELTVEGDSLLATLRCPKRFESCNEIEVTVLGPRSALGAAASASRKFTVATGEVARIRGGRTKGTRLDLTRLGRRFFADNTELKTKIKVRSAETTR